MKELKNPLTKQEIVDSRAFKHVFEALEGQIKLECDIYGINTE